MARTFDASASLVGHWTFDEGAGTSILDSSRLGNHSVLVNPKGNTWTNGHRGGSLYFDGTTGAGATYVAVPADFAGASTNYLHLGGSTSSQSLFYRVKLLP